MRTPRYRASLDCESKKIGVKPPLVTIRTFQRRAPSTSFSYGTPLGIEIDTRCPSSGFSFSDTERPSTDIVTSAGTGPATTENSAFRTGWALNTMSARESPRVQKLLSPSRPYALSSRNETRNFGSRAPTPPDSDRARPRLAGATQSDYATP